jgi:hypothetical protein
MVTVLFYHHISLSLSLSLSLSHRTVPFVRRSGIETRYEKILARCKQRPVQRSTGGRGKDGVNPPDNRGWGSTDSSQIERRRDARTPGLAVRNHFQAAPSIFCLLALLDLRIVFALRQRYAAALRADSSQFPVDRVRFITTTDRPTDQRRCGDWTQDRGNTFLHYESLLIQRWCPRTAG